MKQNPFTSVFGTLSVRPASGDLNRYRYFRYPNGEEHVYDLIADPGETDNLHETAPLNELRQTLIDNALDLGLDLRGFENPARGVNAMMSLDGSVVLAGGNADNNYWAYGENAEKSLKKTGVLTLYGIWVDRMTMFYTPPPISRIFALRLWFHATKTTRPFPKKCRLSPILIHL
jgi:hypothetical protein